MDFKFCPECGTKNNADTKFCTECGGKITQPAPRARQAALVSNTGMMIGRAARQARLTAVYSEDEIVSDLAYNGILLGVLIWGLLVNILLCVFLGEWVTL